MNPVSFYAHAFGVPSKNQAQSHKPSPVFFQEFFFFFSLKILFVLILIFHYLLLGSVGH